MALTDQFRRRVRFCTGLATYSTAAFFQFGFETFYPAVVPQQFLVLGLAWVLLLMVEQQVIETTEYGPHFVMVRSLVGTNALFSIVAGEDLQPLLTEYTYEVPVFLSVACILMLIALLGDVWSDPRISVLSRDS